MTYIINSLQPNTSYAVRVASVNRAGLSEWRGPTPLKTLEKSVSVNLRPNSANKISELNRLLIGFGAVSLIYETWTLMNFI